MMATPIPNRISWFMFFLLSESESPRQKTAVQRRENRLRVLAKPPSGCVCTPVLLPRTRVWDLNPLSLPWRLTADMRLLSMLESAHAQYQSGELPIWLQIGRAHV